jgi:hypothetical protein
MSRAFLAALMLTLAACDAPQAPLRQVTIETSEALGLTLQELPALRSPRQGSRRSAPGCASATSSTP